MEADSRGDVDIHVRMVNHVEAPEQGDGMKHDMLKIDGEVEDQHTEDDSEQRGELKLI